MNTAIDIQKALEGFAAAKRLPIEHNSFHGLFKADTFDQSGSPTTGLTYYDLEPGAKFLYPVPTPLRNIIPRVSGKGGTQANWAAVTGVNVSQLSAGVGQGNRGGIIQVNTQNYNASYKGLGLESNASFEAQYAGQGFDDIRAISTKTLLESLMLQEEQIILLGDADYSLNGGAATPTPSLADSATGGALLNSTAYYVIAVALTGDGYTTASLTNGVRGLVTRTNADGSTDNYGGGAGKVSAEATITTSGTGSNTHSITATVTPVQGALGYAWYLATTSTLERLTAITTTAQYTFTALPTGTNQLASALGSNDNSQNGLVYDGLIYQAFKSATNAMPAYLAQLANGATLTADGAGGVVEIETALKFFWDNYRLGPDTMWVNSQEDLNISKKILGTTSANPGAQRFVFTADPSSLGGGIMVRTYLNKYSMAGGTTVDIKLHPNMPPGTILFTLKSLPYPLSGVGNVFQIKARQDYYQIEWPRRSRKYEYGVYMDGVLQHYAPFSLGVISNITNG